MVEKIRAVRKTDNLVELRVKWQNCRKTTWEPANKVAHIDQTLNFLENAVKPGARKTNETRQIAKYAMNIIKSIRKVSETEPPSTCNVCLDEMCAPFIFITEEGAACGGTHGGHYLCAMCRYILAENQDDQRCPECRNEGHYELKAEFIGED